MDILRLQPGATFEAGLINGPKGVATIHDISSESLTLTFDWGALPPPLLAIRLIMGLPRPQTARDVLREGASLGVQSIDFVPTEKSDPGYSRSSLWRTNQWEELLLAGAAQANSTRIPTVSQGNSLVATVAGLSAGGSRIALDNYESTAALAKIALSPRLPVVLAIGAERGWSPGERDHLRSHGFELANLGPRILRTETACIAAITLLKARLDLP